MTLSRRTLIKSSAAAAATAASARGVALAAPPPTLIVFDSRLPASRAFARRHAARHIDVAKEDESLWRALRSIYPDGRVVGMTGWSDWVVVRGLLEEKGKRLKDEIRAGTLFRWTMG